MTASKLILLNQPGNVIQGQRIIGGQIPGYSSATMGVIVGVADSNGNIVTTDTSTVTAAIGTNPSSGTLSGTTSVAAVNGVAIFDTLSIDKSGNGYTLTFTDGALTSVTTAAFNEVAVNRINPAEFVSAALVGTGVANAQGPFRFRGGATLRGVEISASSNNTTDAVQIVITEPGQAVSANTAAKPTTIQGGSAFQLGPLTCPFHLTMDSNEMGGACDIYVYATTNTGSIIVNIKRMEIGGHL